jgi:hypothetical protein
MLRDKFSFLPQFTPAVVDAIHSFPKAGLLHFHLQDDVTVGESVAPLLQDVDSSQLLDYARAWGEGMRDLTVIAFGARLLVADHNSGDWFNFMG